jgi:Pectate lyase superfamily protein
MYAIRRRLFLGSAFGALALRPPRTAQADTTFTSFSFAATGAPTARTMPDRLSDTVNVKDWGALGTGGATDDTTKIQAAIDYCINTLQGGTVFFPPGTYNVSVLKVGSDTSTIGVRLVGSGKHGTVITGGPSTPGPLGFLISKYDRTYDNIECIEGLTIRGKSTLGCGAIRITANTVNGAVVPNCASIINVIPKGAVGIDCSTAVGVFLRDIGEFAGPPNRPPHLGGPVPGHVGVYLGTGCTLCESRIQGGMDICYALSGYGAGIIGGVASEVSRTGVRVGWRPNATTGLGEEAPAYGCTVQAFQTERDDIGIDLYNCTGGFISGSTITGTSGPFSAPSPVTQVSWVPGTQLVTVETTSPHNIGSPGAIVVVQMISQPASYYPPTSSIGVVVATVTDSTHFTYPGVTVAPTPNPSRGGSWTYPQKYGIRCRKVYDTVIMGVDFQEASSIANVDLEYDGAADHRNNTMVACSAGSHGFKLPTTTPKNLSAWKFIATGKPLMVDFPPTTATVVPNPVGKLTFAGLPAAPMEGMEFDISDSPVAATAANFGANVTTGGGTGASAHVKVRYDGTNWKISG